MCSRNIANSKTLEKYYSEPHLEHKDLSLIKLGVTDTCVTFLQHEGIELIENAFKKPIT